VKKSEVLQLMTMAATIDTKLTPEHEPTLHLWHMILADEPYDLAEQAMVSHYRESEYPLKPQGIVDGVRQLRRERRLNIEAPEPPRDLKPGEYPKWLQAFWHSIDRGADKGTATRDADTALDQPPVRAQIEATPMPASLEVRESARAALRAVTAQAPTD
jgi:hypothetical protein